MRIAGGAALVVIAVSACVELPSTVLAGATPFEAPPVYAEWWRQVESCSGLRGNMGEVRFYRIKDAAWFDYKGEAAYGLYQPGAHRITLAGDYERDGQLVRHEMLHALLRRLEHEGAYFKNRCAFVVSCGANCMDEGGPLPPPPVQAVEATASFLEITIDRPETAVSRGRLTNLIPLTVRIRNPSSGHVYVPDTPALALSASSLTGGSFQLSAIGWTGAPMSLRPFETKIAAFDFRAPTPPTGPADTLEHQVRVALAGHWSPIMTFKSIR